MHHFSHVVPHRQPLPGLPLSTPARCSSSAMASHCALCYQEQLQHCSRHLLLQAAPQKVHLVREVQAHTRRGAVPFTPTAPGTYTQHEAASSGGPVFGRPAGKSAASGQRLGCSHAQLPCSVCFALNEALPLMHATAAATHTVYVQPASGSLPCRQPLDLLGERWFIRCRSPQFPACSEAMCCHHLLSDR